MRLWGYYALHTFVNTIKKMFRSTFLMIFLAIIGFGVIFGLIGGIAGSVVEHQQAVEQASEMEEQGAEHSDEEDAEDVDQPMSPQDIAIIKTHVESAVLLLFLVILLWGMYTGSKNGTEIFQMADVNLLFTAPLKPQSVLMFRLSFQMIATVFASVYLVFQIPNLVINLGLGVYAIVAIFVGWILLLVFQRLMVVLTYTVCSTHEKLKKYVLPFILVIALAVIGVLAAVYASTGDILKTEHMTLSAHWSRIIPVLGWYKGMIMCAVNKEVVPFLIYLALMLISMIVFIIAIWQIPADFYEDALSEASKRAQMLDAAKEGRVVNAKKRSGRIRREGVFGGSGASVFFTKEVYGRRRMAKFGLVTNTMLFYFAVIAVVCVFTIKVVQSHSFFAVGCVLLLVMFFRNMGNPIAQETARNWLFLVPENPYKKVWFSVLAGEYGTAVDLIPGMIAATVIMREQLGIMILWYLTFLIVDFLYSQVGLLMEALIPVTSMDVVKSMIQMILRCLILVILAVLMMIGYFAWGIVGALIVICIASAGIGGAIFLVYPWMLHRGK